MGIEETLVEKRTGVLRWLGHVEKINERRWPRKVKAAKVESQQGRGRLKFVWLEAVREVSLQEATKLEREKSM